MNPVNVQETARTARTILNPPVVTTIVTGTGMAISAPALVPILGIAAVCVTFGAAIYSLHKIARRDLNKGALGITLPPRTGKYQYPPLRIELPTYHLDPLHPQRLAAEQRERLLSAPLIHSGIKNNSAPTPLSSVKRTSTTLTWRDPKYWEEGYPRVLQPPQFSGQTAERTRLFDAFCEKFGLSPVPSRAIANILSFTKINIASALEGKNFDSTLMERVFSALQRIPAFRTAGITIEDLRFLGTSSPRILNDWRNPQTGWGQSEHGKRIIDLAERLVTLGVLQTKWEDHRGEKFPILDDLVGIIGNVSAYRENLLQGVAFLSEKSLETMIAKAKAYVVKASVAKPHPSIDEKAEQVAQAVREAFSPYLRQPVERVPASIDLSPYPRLKGKTAPELMRALPQALSEQFAKYLDYNLSETRRRVRNAEDMQFPSDKKLFDAYIGESLRNRVPQLIALLRQSQSQTTLEAAGEIERQGPASVGTVTSRFPSLLRWFRPEGTSPIPGDPFVRDFARDFGPKIVLLRVGSTDALGNLLDVAWTLEMPTIPSFIALVTDPALKRSYQTVYDLLTNKETHHSQRINPWLLLTMHPRELFEQIPLPLPRGGSSEPFGTLVSSSQRAISNRWALVIDILAQEYVKAPHDETLKSALRVLLACDQETNDVPSVVGSFRRVELLTRLAEFTSLNEIASSIRIREITAFTRTERFLDDVDNFTQAARRTLGESLHTIARQRAKNALEKWESEKHGSEYKPVAPPRMQSGDLESLRHIIESNPRLEKDLKVIFPELTR